MGSSEFIMIGAALLVLFGGKQLPELLRNIAKIINNFKRMTNQLKREAGLDMFDDIMNPPRHQRPPMPPPPPPSLDKKLEDGPKMNTDKEEQS